MLQLLPKLEQLPEQELLTLFSCHQHIDDIQITWWTMQWEMFIIQTFKRFASHVILSYWLQKTGINGAALIAPDVQQWIEKGGLGQWSVHWWTWRTSGRWKTLCQWLSYRTSTCVLSNLGLSNATSKRPKFVEKRGNYCRDTAKTGIRTPLKSDIYFRFVTETIVD